MVILIFPKNDHIKSIKNKKKWENLEKFIYL